MKILFLLIVSVLTTNLLFAPKATANPIYTSNGAEVCFQGVAQANATLDTMAFQVYMNDRIQQNAHLFKMAYQCNDIKVARAAIAGVVFTLTIGSIYAAATGVGVPVTVGLNAANASLNLLSFLISLADCEDTKKITQQIEVAVCESLMSQGEVTCVPGQIKILEQGDIKRQCEKRSSSLGA